MDKAGGFIGREALLRQKERGLTRRLVQFVMEDVEPLLYHNEPILRDGEIVGRITSGMFGHTIARAIGLGYVENGGEAVTPEFIQSIQFEIEVAAARFRKGFPQAALRSRKPSGEGCRGASAEPRRLGANHQGIGGGPRLAPGVAPAATLGGAALAFAVASCWTLNAVLVRTISGVESTAARDAHEALGQPCSGRSVQSDKHGLRHRN